MTERFWYRRAQPGIGGDRMTERFWYRGQSRARITVSKCFAGPSARRWLVGCALVLPIASTVACRGAAPVIPNRWRLALTPASFSQTISLQQHVQVEQAGRNVEFEAVLDITPDTVTLIGLAFNQRVFTLKYDGVKLQESRSKMLPREVQAADVLSDMQLALWPSEAVRSALPTGWALRDSSGSDSGSDSDSGSGSGSGSGTRVLSERDTVRTTITYTANPRWTGTITLENKQYDYRLVIRSAVSN